MDDLNDHWTASHHKKERNQLIHDCQKLAVECRLRVTFLSGDVHACCVTKLHNVKKIEPAQDPKYMVSRYCYCRGIERSFGFPLSFKSFLRQL